MHVARTSLTETPCCHIGSISTTHHRNAAFGHRSPFLQSQSNALKCQTTYNFTPPRLCVRINASKQATEAPLPPFSPVIDSKPLDEPTPGFDSIPDALAAMARGEAVVVLDDEDRENEGDLILAADRITPEAMAFVVNHTSGVVCIGMKGADLDRLRIPLMVPTADNEESMTTAFTITVDLREGTSTGISAADRAATMRALASSSSLPEDFKRPGHIFPLRYRHGGVLRRPGHTEASVDLSFLAGCAPAGVLCEIVNPDGTMSRTDELQVFAEKYNLKIITIADLVRYRLKHDTLIERVASGPLPTRYGTFLVHTYRNLIDGSEHIALVAGEPHQGSNILTRIHSESMLGDIFGSERCDSGSQLDAALHDISTAGQGVLVYLRGQQGRGLGIADELETYTLSGDSAACASPAAMEDASFPVDLRDYSVAAHVLKDIGVSKIRLMTNNMTKVNCMKAHGINVVEQVPLVPPTVLVGGLDSGDGVRRNSHTSGHSRSSRNGAEPHFV